MSHRGYWKQPEEKNTPEAFRRSFASGFGTETDIRDFGGNLVISHGPPSGKELRFEEFLSIYSEFPGNFPLALNIKADGLQDALKNTLMRFGVTNYFVFDASVPDSLQYVKRAMEVFTRESEYEKMPAFYELASGVWIDAFDGDWLTEETLIRHVANGKSICMVSPELHGREYQAFWKKILAFGLLKKKQIMLCTDLPEKAREFFS